MAALLSACEAASTPHCEGSAPNVFPWCAPGWEVQCTAVASDVDQLSCLDFNEVRCSRGDAPICVQGSDAGL